MATFVLTDAFLSVGGTDLSDHVRSITVNYEGEAVEDTNMADTTRLFVGGLLNWSVDVEFSQDYAASKVDATLWSLVGTTAALVIRPDSGVASSTNPEFTGTGLLTNYVGIGNTVGDLATATATFVAASALSRGTS